MKQPKKLWNGRFKQEDLVKWRLVAVKENRTLTNLIETVLNKHCKIDKR